jgi:signal transduction histidine kinase
VLGYAWGFIGFAAGVGLAAVAAWQVQRRHTLRVRMAERRARAAERMAEIGAMTGGLAHEIKNPLSTIGLNAQLLHEAIQDLELPEDDRSRLLSRTKALRRETERLGGILTDFLEYAGQIHLDRKPADLNGVVSELADFFLPEAERHGVRLHLQLAPDRLMADVDVKLLKQALLNLMLNATQAMHGAKGASSQPIPAGAAGELIVRTEAAQDADGRPIAMLHVVDSGPGISPETLPKIFNPYFTTRSGGSGLGLPTCRRLIEEHGGRIDVSSVLGQGSDFIVVLPREPQPAAG